MEQTLSTKPRSGGSRSLLRRLATDGTAAMAVGSLVAGAAAYAFQVLGGRALGAAAFAPVGALLSAHYLVFTILLIPVELLTVRRLSLESKGTAPKHSATRPVGLILAVSTAGMGLFVIAARDRFFEGDTAWLLPALVVVLGHGVFVLGRGYLAGRRRYSSYGLVSAGAAMLRVLLAAGVLLVMPSGAALAWTIALAPLLVLAWRPFTTTGSPATILRRDERGTGVFLAGFVLAGAISQALIVAGPLLVGLLGGSAVAVSVVFVTLNLGRAPLLVVQNLASRLLAPLSRLVADARVAALRSWAIRLGVAGIVAAPVGYLLGAALGPFLVALLFGEEFRPGGLFAGLVGAGVVLAAGSIFLDQVLVALGETVRLATAWLVGLAAAAMALFVITGTPATRVAAAMVAGELVALVAALVAALASARPDSAAEAEAGAQEPRPRDGYELAKRGLDAGVAAVLLLVTSPLVALVAVAVKLDSPGPVFFRQRRVGRGQAPIELLKFRTMRWPPGPEVLHAHLDSVSADGGIVPSNSDEGPRLRIDDDPRVTRVGRLLRKFYLDELPNLWNVLRGDLSLVGPRPLVPEEAALYNAEAQQRHQVTPGLTGLAQVEGGTNLTFAQRAYFDLRYVEQRSLGLDLTLLARTIPAVLRRRRP